MPFPSVTRQDIAAFLSKWKRLTAAWYKHKEWLHCLTQKDNNSFLFGWQWSKSAIHWEQAQPCYSRGWRSLASAGSLWHGYGWLSCIPYSAISGPDQIAPWHHHIHASAPQKLFEMCRVLALTIFLGKMTVSRKEELHACMLFHSYECTVIILILESKALEVTLTLYLFMICRCPALPNIHSGGLRMKYMQRKIKHKSNTSQSECTKIENWISNHFCLGPLIDDHVWANHVAALVILRNVFMLHLQSKDPESFHISNVICIFTPSPLIALPPLHSS